MGTHILEPAAQELADATATPLPVRAEHRPDNQVMPCLTARRSTSWSLRVARQAGLDLIRTDNQRIVCNLSPGV